jgi:hypothetical protein
MIRLVRFRTAGVSGRRYQDGAGANMSEAKFQQVPVIAKGKLKRIATVSGSIKSDRVF